MLSGYAAVYCLPCLVLVVGGALAHGRVRGRLQRLVTQFTTGLVKRSLPLAIGSMALGLAVAGVPFFLP